MSKHQQVNPSDGAPLNDVQMLGDAEDPQPIVRSDIWLSDGNVVLQAEQTQFRVHKMVLARHSTVFSDLFGLPHPEDEPKVEGCPVVVLHDTAEDVNFALLALYDKCYHKVDGPIPFGAVAAMIRMGRKYDIKDLASEGLSRLKLAIPSKLNRSTVPKTEYLVPEDRLLFKVINFALDFGIQTVLTGAYLECVMAETDDYMDPCPPEIQAHQARQAGYLSNKTQRLIAQAREHIPSELLTSLFKWVSGVGQFCDDRASCQGKRLALIKAVWRDAGPRTFSLKTDWDEFKRSLQFMATEFTYIEEELCHFCLDMAEDSFNTAKSDCWDLLPRRFGLPDWQDMRDFE